MARKRTKRTERRGSPGSVRLGERDIGIMTAVGKMKLLRTMDIARLYFSSKQTANKRLRRLLDSGYLDCFVSALHEDNIYGLSRKGRSALLERDCEEAERFGTPRGLGHTNLKHLFALNAFRISLVLGLHERPNLELAFFKSEWELKRQENPLNPDLIPDALFGLSSVASSAFTVIRGGAESAAPDTTPMKRARPKNGSVLALEVDLGTEHPKLVGKQKVAKYRAIIDARLPLFGHVISQVLFVAPRLRRLHHLAKVMMEYGVFDEFLLGLGPWARDGDGWDLVCSAGALIRGLDGGLVGGEMLRDSIVDRPRKGTHTGSPYGKRTLTGGGEVVIVNE